MKRSMVLAMCVGCFLAGLALRPVASVMAQGKIQAEEDAKTSARAVPGKALYISSEEIKKRFVDAAPQGATHLMWDPAYRFTVMRRPYYETAKKMNSLFCSPLLTSCAACCQLSVGAPSVMRKIQGR